MSDLIRKMADYHDVIAKQQSEIDQLKTVLDERTKEWLQAIECGTYFENVAKPLKDENEKLKAEKADLLKAIDNEIERCVSSANAPIRDDHDKGWRNAMLSVRDGFKRLRGEHE